MDEPRKSPLFQTNGIDDPCVVARGKCYVVLDARKMPYLSLDRTKISRSKPWLLYVAEGKLLGQFEAYPTRKAALALFLRREAEGQDDK